MRITRRGALEAFNALSSQFGLSLFDAVPKSLGRFERLHYCQPMVQVSGSSKDQSLR